MLTDQESGKVQDLVEDPVEHQEVAPEDPLEQQLTLEFPAQDCEDDHEEDHLAHKFKILTVIHIKLNQAHRYHLQYMHLKMRPLPISDTHLDETGNQDINVLHAVSEIASVSTK